MGALHDGHLSLIRTAVHHHGCTKMVASIFVNPSQFAPHEDLSKYPRPFEKDVALLTDTGLVDALFHPSPAELYPKGHPSLLSGGGAQNGAPFQGTVVTPFAFEQSREGMARPQFLRGVATVCTKLFNIVQPTKAFFGQKDAIQALMLQRMVEDLNVPLGIVIVETAREADGLAMSSRNIYLSPAERQRAPIIYQGLLHVKNLVQNSKSNNASPVKVGELRESLIAFYDSKSTGGSEYEGVHQQVEYVSFADAETGLEITDSDLVVAISSPGQKSKILVSVAVMIGKTRLIDNILI
jgi:pantoate--beta-alanine ligase